MVLIFIDAVEPIDETKEVIRETYRKISNISRTKAQNLNDPSLFMQLSLSNPLKPSVKTRMEM